MNEENQNAIVTNSTKGLDLQALGANNVTDVPIEHPIPSAPPDTGQQRAHTYVWDPVRDNADPSLSTAAERQSMGLETPPQMAQPTPQQMMQMMMQMMMGGMMQQQPQQVPPVQTWAQNQPQAQPAPQPAPQAQTVQIPVQQPEPTPTITTPDWSVNDYMGASQSVREVPSVGVMQAPAGGRKVISISLHSQNPEGDGVKINGLMVLTDLLKLTLPGVKVQRNAIMMQIVMPDYEGDVQSAMGAIMRYDLIGTLGEEQAMRRASSIAAVMPPGAMGAGVVRQYLNSWYLGHLEASI